MSKFGTSFIMILLVIRNLSISVVLKFFYLSKMKSCYGFYLFIVRFLPLTTARMSSVLFFYMAMTSFLSLVSDTKRGILISDDLISWNVFTS